MKFSKNIVHGLELVFKNQNSLGEILYFSDLKKLQINVLLIRGKQGEGTGPNICRQVLYNFSTQLCQSTPWVTLAFNGKCVFLCAHKRRRMRPPS